MSSLYQAKEQTLSSQPAIHAVLERARTLGFLGPGPLRVHIQHADYYLEAIPPDTGRLVDLGSGGGLPGLPLLLSLPNTQGRLVDGSEKRCEFLAEVLPELGLEDRVEVVVGRAEKLSHLDEHRGWADVVVSRSFGAPHHTVECGMGFVRPGGLICISEPPGGRKWPADQLSKYGLSVEPTSSHIACLRVEGGPMDGYPRSFKRQERKPLFTFS